MRGLFWRRRQREKDLEEEIRAHLEMAQRARLERGETPEQAQEEAHKEFGNITLVKEVTQEIWGWAWLRRLVQDIRYSARMLRKKPGFSMLAIMTLALGIGANTALFSLVNAVLLTPFPYPDQSRIYYVRQRLPKLGVQDHFGATGPEFSEIAEGKVFERAAAVAKTLSRNLTGTQEPERISAAMVSADFFPLLGVQPLLGRTITASDEGPAGNRVVVINHSLWERRFGGRPDVIGQKIFLDDEPFTIVGVMPPQFYFESRSVFLPFPLELARLPRRSQANAMLVRIKAGVSLAEANTELELIARNQELAFGSSQPEYAGRSIYLESINEFYFEHINRMLVMLLTAVGLMLLIACANVATLLLARATTRTREIALRAALGASRFRIARQLLVESMALAFLGGAFGVLLAFLGVDAIVALIPPETIPQEIQIKINGQVLLFTFLISLMSASLFGLWPALSLSKPDLHQALKESARHSSAARGQVRARNLLVVFQVAISLLLVVMAGLLVRSLNQLMSVDPGLNPDKVLTMRLNVSPARLKGGERMAAIFQQLIDRVQTVPGVQFVGVASHIPIDQTATETVSIESNASQGNVQTQSVDTRTVSTDYFQAMGIQFIKGQPFTTLDKQDAPGVVIINQAMARRFWPNEDAVGKRLKPGTPTSGAPWMTIKGVVADSIQSSFTDSINPEVYFPHAQMADCCRRMNLVIRTNANPTNLINPIKREIQSVYKDQPIYNVRTMEEWIKRSVSRHRFAMILLGVFACLSLMLASIGAYSVISYSVARRTGEFGLRIALGARRQDVLRLVLKQGMLLVAIGVAVGLFVSAALTRLMVSQLFGVSPTDLLTFVMGASLLICVAFIACWVPARRATKVDPLVALRCE